MGRNRKFTGLVDRRDESEVWASSYQKLRAGEEPRSSPDRRGDFAPRAPLPWLAKVPRPPRFVVHPHHAGSRADQRQSGKRPAVGGLLSQYLVADIIRRHRPTAAGFHASIDGLR